MSFDAHANFSYGTVLIAPSPPLTDTALTLNAGQGALMPAVPFNATVWPSASLAYASVSEIVRVTNVAGDVLTITRAQEGSAAVSIAVGFQFAATITKKTITDVEAATTKAFSAAGGSSTFDTLEFINANANVSFNNAGGSISANAYILVQGQGAAFSNYVGGISLVDASGVSWSVNGASIAASVKTDYLTNIKVSAGTLSQRRSDLTFDNAGGVSFGLETNGVITAAAGTAAPSPVFVSAGTTDGSLGTIRFADGSGVSWGLNGSTITATVKTAYAGVGETVGTIAGTDLAMTVDTAGVSIGYPKWITTYVAQTNQSAIRGFGVSNTGATAGNTGISTGLDWVVAGSNLLTLSQSTTPGGPNTVWFQHPAWLTTARASTDAIGLNTAKTNVTWTVNSAGLSFDAGGYAGTGFTSTTTAGTDIKATHNTAGLSMAVPAFLTAAGGVQTGISGIIVSDASYTSGTVSFSNQANITIGSSVNGATQYIRLSVNAQSVQSAIKGLGASNTGNTAGNTGMVSGVDWVIAGSNNITISQSTAVGGPNTLWVSGGAAGGVTGISGIGASDTTYTSGTVIHSAQANITIGTSVNGASQYLRYSVAAPGAALLTGNVYATGNTTQNSSSSQDYSSVLYAGRGAISLGFSGGTMQVSAPATSSLVGTNGVAISTNGSTISVSGWTMPDYEPYPLLNANSTTYAPVTGSIYLQPMLIPGNILGGRANRLTQFGSTASILRDSSANYQTATTGSRAARFQYSNVLGLYSLGAGTNSTRLESFWSSMFSLELSHIVSVSSAAGPNMTARVSGTISYIQSIDSLGAATTGTFSSTGSVAVANSSIGTTALTSVLASIRNMLSNSVLLPVPVNTTITPGAYWMAEFWTTASSTTGTSGDVLSIVHRVGLFGNTLTAYRNWGATVVTSGSQVFPGQGVFSGTSAAIPATMAFSDIRTIASQIVQHVVFCNSTI